MPEPTIFTVETQTGAPSTLPDATQIAVDKVDTVKDVQYLKILDAANASKRGMTVNADGSINVLAALLGDPATQATLADILAKLIALPATEAKQDTGNASLATIAGKDFATQAELAALSGKLGIPSSDDVLALLRTIVTNTALEVTRTETLTLTADQVNLNTDQVETKLDTVNSRLGQVGTSGSLADLLDLIRTKLNATLAVTGTFWQATQPVSGPLTDTQLRATAVPVSGTVTASGPLTDAQLRATAVPVSNASLPLPAGAATEATLDARTGILTEAAPATDTASSGLNGRLQRIAQRLTTLLAGGLPAALAAGGGLKVEGVAGGVAQPVSHSPATAAAQASVASSASSVTLQASNANRRGLMIYNDSTAILYVRFGATATTANYTIQMAAASYYELPKPCYTGVIDGIWASANGNARVTEIT